MTLATIKMRPRVVSVRELPRNHPAPVSNGATWYEVILEERSYGQQVRLLSQDPHKFFRDMSVDIEITVG